VDASVTERSAWRPGWSQNDCLPGTGSEGVPKDVDQSESSVSKSEPIRQLREFRICLWLASLIDVLCESEILDTLCVAGCSLAEVLVEIQASRVRQLQLLRMICGIR